MFFIYGQRRARIKRYNDHHQSCPECKSFDINIEVYRNYYHVWYLPFLPAGSKDVFISCNQCNKPIRSESLRKHYEGITRLSRTPFYLYSGVLLIAAGIVWLVIANLQTQKQKALWVAAPMVGDVYLIRKDSASKPRYFFLRLSGVNGDTLYAYHNKYEYNGFVSRLEQDDYFVKDEELQFTKQVLTEMLEKEEINSVERSYGSEEGFNRIK